MNSPWTAVIVSKVRTPPCRIIYLPPPYSHNLGKRIIKAPKVYFLNVAAASRALT
jgi:predicted AAA+ superfamily ATPase